MKTDNLAELKMLQARQEALELKLKEMDTTNPNFAATQQQAIAVSYEIDSILRLIDNHNKNLSQKLNAAQEHVIGVFINPATSFQL